MALTVGKVRRNVQKAEKSVCMILTAAVQHMAALTLLTLSPANYTNVQTCLNAPTPTVFPIDECVMARGTVSMDGMNNSALTSLVLEWFVVRER